MGSGRLRPGWTRVAFGDVARHVKDRVDPVTAKLRRYVAGEHMDTDDLRIRRWGTVGDGYLGPAFHARFRPGHVLYGSRRTYLRKVAVADFEGVTANTTFVIETRDPSSLLPELLPFTMQTESFHEHSIKKSKGSVNPYVNFSDIAAYEFALPPLDEQRRITALLRSHVETRDAHSLALARLNALLKRYISDTYASLKNSYPLLPTAALGASLMGRQKSPKYRLGNNPIPYLRVANIGPLGLDLTRVEQMDFTARELARYQLLPGDILLTEGDIVSALNVGRPAVYNGEISNCAFQNTLIRLRLASGIPPMFALFLLEGARLNHVFAKAAKTTTVTHLGLGRFRNVVVPIPDSETRNALAQRLSTLLRARDKLTSRVQSSVRLGRALLARALAVRGGIGPPTASA